MTDYYKRKPINTRFDGETDDEWIEVEQTLDLQHDFRRHEGETPTEWIEFAPALEIDLEDVR